MKPLIYDKDLVKKYLTIYRKINNIRHVLDCYQSPAPHVIQVDFVDDDFEYRCTTYMSKIDFETYLKNLETKEVISYLREIFPESSIGNIEKIDNIFKCNYGYMVSDSFGNPILRTTDVKVGIIDGFYKIIE